MTIARLEKIFASCNQEDKENSAEEYIKAGGSVLELIKSIDTKDKKNMNNVYIAFSAMHSTIIKILSSFPQKQSSAEEACQYLINSHLSSIHSMLSIESSAKHRKIVLKLLAAVVSLGGTFPREILNHLSFHQKLVAALTDHSNPSDRQSVRTCFIHFILAFLIEGNAQDIRALLEKHGVFSSIFSGLIYDYPDIVQLVLTSTRQYILENPAITKTTKLHVFSTPVIQSIVNLYNWKGPNNWLLHKKKDLVEKFIDPNQKEVVVDAVHQFLTILLTSNKYGIVFHDKKLGTDSNKKNNLLINSILKSLEKPWEHKKPSELVVLVLRACPDLIKSQLLYTEPYVAPRVSKKWFDVMEFISKIISNIDEERCLKLCSSEMKTENLLDAILNLITPKNIIKNCINPSLENSSLLVRHAAVSLLLSMINKALSITKVFEKSVKNFNSANFSRTISDHTFKIMPTFETILEVWSKAFMMQSEAENSVTDDISLKSFEIKDHIMSILNFLENYCTICPEILVTADIESMKTKPSVLISNLSALKDFSEEELNIMKVKALKILLKSNVYGFSPNEEIFSFALSFLLTIHDDKSKVEEREKFLDFEVHETTKLLLSNCGVFEGFNEEIDVWIEAFEFLENRDEKSEVASWFIHTIKRIYKHTEKYVSLVHKVEKNIEEEMFDASKQEDLFNELSEKNFKEVKSLVSTLPVASISLVTYASIENLQKNSSGVVDYYMSIVLSHVLHFQISTKVLLSLVEKVKTPADKYLKNWNSAHNPNFIKKPFKHHQLIINKNNVEIEKRELHAYKAEVVDNLLIIQQGDSILKIKLTGFYIKSLIRMILFYLMQFTQRNMINEQNMIFYKDILFALLNAEQNSDRVQESARWIFRHPIFLQYFHVFYKNEASSEKIITDFFIQICRLFSSLNLETYISQFLQPYQEKFIAQIKSAVKKNSAKNLNNYQLVHEKLIAVLQLSRTSMKDTLGTIMKLSEEKFVTKDKSSLSIWGNIIPPILVEYSIGNSKNETTTSSVISGNLFKKIFFYFIKLRNFYNQKIDSWETSLHEYLVRFPHGISVIDEKMLTSLLETNVTPASTKLITLLLKGNSKLISAFKIYANNNENIFTEKALVFSILSHNLSYKWDKEFLDKLYKIYKDDIISFIKEIKIEEFFWINENIEAAAFLIEKNFEPDLCKKVCDVILSSGTKLEDAQKEHIKLFQSLFYKSKKENDNALKDLIQILIYLTVSALKKDAKNISKLEFLSIKLVETITTLKSTNNYAFEEIMKNHSWPQFIRISLKNGLKITKNTENSKKNYSFLISALAETVDIAYQNNGNNEYIKTIFEMTMAHTEFMKIMLSNNEVKGDLVKLLLILLRKSPTLLVATHIPIYLASYNASLTISDQLILKILKLYESNGIQLDGYRPYLWGNAAASYYNVNSKINNALWRQPSTSQVFDLLVPEIVHKTIKNYPVNRSWNDDLIGKFNDEKEVYDPAFYLPVFVHLLSENNVVACSKVIHSGALALAIISCSSLDKDVRLAGFTVISRFHFHLEATSSKEKLLWINFIDSLRNGIIKTESPLENIRLSGFVATFLSRASLIMAQPLDDLYSPLQNFLMVKPALDLNTVPEVLQLFHSSEIDHIAHRHWILEVIRDGFKTDNDMDIALRCVLFKMLLDFYNCSLADKLTKNLILQIVCAVTKLSKPCMLLINGYALTPWLSTVYQHLKIEDTDSTTYLSNIVNNILHVFDESKIKKENYHYLFFKNMSHSLEKQFQATQ